MPVIEVSEANDPRLKPYVGLTDVALRSVSEPVDGLFIAESQKVIRRAVAAGYPVRSVLSMARYVTGIADVVGDVPIYVAPEDLLHEVTGFRVHRGALAEMARTPLPWVAEVVKDARRIVVLEDLVEHSNVGALMRSAAALGIDAVVVSPKCVDPLYRRAVKVSMGAVFQIPWTRATSWPGALDDLTAAGFTLAALSPRSDALSLPEFTAQAPERVALLLGSEGPGLTEEAFDRATTMVRIPMRDEVDSLNVAAAAAVAFYALGPGSAMNR